MTLRGIQRRCHAGDHRAAAEIVKSMKHRETRVYRPLNPWRIVVNVAD
jgi:hypothetical protein